MVVVPDVRLREVGDVTAREKVKVAPVFPPVDEHVDVAPLEGENPTAAVELAHLYPPRPIEVLVSLGIYLVDSVF